MHKYFWIILIVLLAGFLRFWHLTQVPPSLNSDEVAIGYNAYSVIKTGRDEYNTPYPYTFRSFDDYKMPVYVYLVAGSMKLFGFGDFAVRFPSALLGTITVFFTYLLAYELFKRRDAALTSAFLMAISPWSLQFSRTGYEANVAVFFIVLGIYLFMKGLSRGVWLICSSVSFSAAVWTYLTPRIFVPLLVISLGLLYRKELLKKKNAVIAAVAVALVLLWPVARMSLSAQGQMRAAGVSAFSNTDDLKKSVSRLAVDKGIFRIFDNRRFTYAITFLRGYFAHFDPNFLFLDKSIEKYRAPDVGLLYLFELPLIVVGGYMMIRKRSRSSAVIFWWIAAAPVAAAFTLQLPHPVRTLVFLPMFQLLSALGLVNIWQRIRWSRIIIIAIIAFSFTYYVHQYFVFLPIEDAQYWYVGRREMSAEITRLKSQYDTIYVSNALDFPYIFYLYYGRIDPVWYQRQGGTVSGGFEEQGNRVGNVSFRSINSSLQDPLKKILFVGLPGEVFKQSRIYETIRYPDGTPAIVFFQ
jgi:4-amino-4-deoxy-L-arabinose transferase-like glycosyltransferase